MLVRHILNFQLVILKTLFLSSPDIQNLGTGGTSPTNNNVDYLLFILFYFLIFLIRMFGL